MYMYFLYIINQVIFGMVGMSPTFVVNKNRPGFIISRRGLAQQSCHGAVLEPFYTNRNDYTHAIGTLLWRQIHKWLILCRRTTEF